VYQIQIKPKKKIMTQFNQHIDFMNGYRIDYPVDWQCRQISPTQMGFYAPPENSVDAFSENVTVGMEYTPQSLDQYIEFQVAQMQTIGGFQLISRNESYLANLPGQKLEFSGHMGPAMLQLLVAVILKNKLALIVTYTAQADAYNKYMPIVDAMLNSLKLN